MRIKTERLDVLVNLVTSERKGEDDGLLKLRFGVYSALIELMPSGVYEGLVYREGRHDKMVEVKSSRLRNIAREVVNFGWDCGDGVFDPRYTYGDHVALTCENHPNLRWSTKNIGGIGMRNIFFSSNWREEGDERPYDIECSCPAGLLHPVGMTLEQYRKC
jgi:hypothetical protein